MERSSKLVPKSNNYITTYWIPSISFFTCDLIQIKKKEIFRKTTFKNETSKLNNLALNR